jgi:NAD(P)H-dependent flavin oxidoreductase YrpB (nitropropane dioxygenase family)
MKQKFKTKITQMLGIDHPILCGGMQWITRAEFVSEICNAGAIGFITAESFDTPEDLREEIKKIRELTDKPFGVNISMLPEFKVQERTQQFCDIVCQENVPVVETAGRDPSPIIPQLKDSGIKVIHKMTSVKHAQKAQRVGVDAVTLIGYGSGGHIGLDDVASFILIPLAVSKLSIPVIAGGGVCNGQGLLGALAMGAEAVLMGTAFMATKECPIHPAIKERLIQTSEKETVIVMSSIQNPLRCIRNKLAEEIIEMEQRGTTLEEIISVMAGGKGKKAYEIGDCEMSPIACGQITGMINSVKTVSELIEEIISQAEALRIKINNMTS